MDAYDNWKTSPPEVREAFLCDHCDEGIDEGEQFWDLDNGDKIHEDCWDAYATNALGACKMTAARPERGFEDDN